MTRTGVPGVLLDGRMEGRADHPGTPADQVAAGAWEPRER